MERVSAFKPKAKVETDSRNPESFSRPLQTVEKDRSKIACFNFALNAILTGGITREGQLRILRDWQANQNNELTDTTGARLVVDRRYVRPEELDGGRLDEEGFANLSKILKERVSATSEKAEVDGKIACFNFALNAILTGGITREGQLRILRDWQANQNNELTDTTGARLIVDRRYVRPEELDGGRLDEEGFVLLRRVFVLISNPDCPTEIKENFKRYAQTGDVDTLGRLETILSVSGDSTISSEAQSLISDLMNIKRVSELKRDVYDGIERGIPLSDIEKTISSFEGKGVDDIQLVAKLQTAVTAKRKRDTLVSAVLRLQRKERNIDACLQEASPLLGSRRADDREAGVGLVKIAYAAEIAKIKETVQNLMARGVDPEELRLFLESIPLRPAIADIDYTETIGEVRQNAFASVSELLKIRRLDAATKIREDFASLGVDLVLANIENFPEETEEDIAIKNQLLELYKTYVATNKPDVFDATFANALRVQVQKKQEAAFTNTEKGKNTEAFNFVRTRFIETIYPLIESLRGDRATEKKANSFLKTEDASVGKANPRRQFEQRLSTLEKQRPLTDTERGYLQSVELLSFFNPYLVACASTDQGVTNEFLRHHFETLSKETTAGIQDGDYFPLVHAGLGPNGLAALGEVVRNNAALASTMLVVDAGKQPGGPFAIPEGPAWELNSANKRGTGERILPKAPGPDELKTVRAYGSPATRWYPGERGESQSIRQGSINTSVDYLLTPDDISNARYPSNEEEQITLSLQAAVLTKKVALQTKIVALEKNPNPHVRGDKRVTLEITDATGVRQVKITTDAIFGATGLGEAGYGFGLEGSKAEKVIEQTKDSTFPKITRTLEAFNALAGRTNEQAPPGETLVIWGKGNSADVLIEYVGNLFQGDNPKVRDITKVYLIAEGDLSARPRYSLINDLKPRNGRGNLIEQVNARVTDVDFASLEGNPDQRQLVFLGKDSKPITDAEGTIIQGDFAIAATGFRSSLDSLLEGYARNLVGEQEVQQSLREPLALPTNDEVIVAEILRADPSILILGTSSKPEFNQAKLAQLPVEAREALLRNGAENAVAIGFRAPDVQAAVNIWLNSREITVTAEPAKSSRQLFSVTGGREVSPKDTFWLEQGVDLESLKIPNNVRGNEVRFLSPLFAYTVGNAVELTTSAEKKFTGEVTFTLTYDVQTRRLGFSLGKENKTLVGEKMIGAVKKACEDMDFQKYATVALLKKRRKPELDLVLSFKNGFVDPKNTFVQE